MKKLLAIALAILGANASALEATPELPPAEVVARVLRATPAFRVASSRINVEEANRQRLGAGSYEWSLRLGGQQRRATPSVAQAERFNEWNAALERPLRLPGKAGLDAELGASGVAAAEMAQGDAIHEASRSLLKQWFSWLRENVSVRQWGAQVRLLEQQAEAVRRRQQLGDVARLETVQAEAALAQAAAQLAQNRLRQQTAAENLRRRYPELPLVEPTRIGEPQAIAGKDADWIAAILEHSHELGMAREETKRARLNAERQRHERTPDPSVGVQYSRERGGEEQVFGVYVSIPLPGEGRRATSTAAIAEAESARLTEEGIEQQVGSAAANLVYAARNGVTSWQAARQAADRLGEAAQMTARAYQLGEGSLGELLMARRQANEAELSAHLGQLEALEQRYQVLLDAHQLWDLD